MGKSLSAERCSTRTTGRLCMVHIRSRSHLTSLSGMDKKIEAEQAYTGYETINDMPIFYQELKQTLTYPLAWGNAPEKDFSRWREQARRKLLECMQPAPPESAFDMKVIESEQREGYTAQKSYLTFPNGLACRHTSWYLKEKVHFLLSCYYTTMVHISPSEKKRWYVRFTYQKSYKQMQTIG